MLEAQDKASREIADLRNQIKSLQNDMGAVSGTFQRSSSSMMSSLRKLAPYVAGAFAVREAKRFAGEMFNTSVALEALDNKANIVLGSMAATVRETADQVAISMGMSRDEFVGATADIADILVPL